MSYILSLLILSRSWGAASPSWSPQPSGRARRRPPRPGRRTFALADDARRRVHLLVRLLAHPRARALCAHGRPPVDQPARVRGRHHSWGWTGSAPRSSSCPPSSRLLSILSSRSLIDKREPAYYSLLLLAQGSVMGAFTSLNLVVFYLFWELTLIPMFFLIGIWGGDRRKYAALKFIIFTFAGSAVMLLGFLALYFGGRLDHVRHPSLVGKIPAGLQYLPLLAVFIGLAVELPVFPFHSWQPDAYEQAPAPVNALLSGILPKFAGYAADQDRHRPLPAGRVPVRVGLHPRGDLLDVLRRGRRPRPERPEADVRLHEHQPHGLRPLRGVRDRRCRGTLSGSRAPYC